MPNFNSIWYRLCIDVLPSGQPIGHSWERRGDDGVTRIAVLGPPGPFDEASFLLSALLTDIVRIDGVQMRMPY